MLDALKQIFVKYVSQLFLILTVAGLAWFAWSTHSKLKDTESKYQDLVGQQEKYQKLNEYVASLERKYADAQTLQAQLQKDWSKEKGDLQGQIKLLADAQFSNHSDASALAGADYTDPSGQWSLFEARYLKNGKAGPAVCLFQLYKDGKAVTKVYDSKIQVDVAVSRDPGDGKYTILTKAFYVLTEPDIQGKYIGSTEWENVYYPLDVSGGSATIDPTEAVNDPTFRWWDPHLNGGINFGFETGGFFARPSLDVSLMGYGKSSNDLKWKFLDFGVSFEPSLKFFDVHFMPFLYRPFDSFITNTYIGPGISTSTRGTGYFLGLSLGF